MWTVFQAWDAEVILGSGTAMLCLAGTGTQKDFSLVISKNNVL